MVELTEECFSGFVSSGRTCGSVAMPLITSARSYVFLAKDNWLGSAIMTIVNGEMLAV